MPLKKTLRLASAAFATACLLVSCHKNPPKPPPPAPSAPNVNAFGSAHWVGAGAQPDSFKLTWESTDTDFVLLPDIADAPQNTNGTIGVSTKLSGLTIGAYQLKSKSLSLKRVNIEIQHDPSTNAFNLMAATAFEQVSLLQGPGWPVDLRVLRPDKLVAFVVSFFRKRQFAVHAARSEGTEGDYVFTTDHQPIESSERFVERRIQYQLFVREYTPALIQRDTGEYKLAGCCTLRAQIQKRGHLENTWQDDSEMTERAKPLLIKLGKELDDESAKYADDSGSSMDFFLRGISRFVAGSLSFEAYTPRQLPEDAKPDGWGIRFERRGNPQFLVHL